MCFLRLLKQQRPRTLAHPFLIMNGLSTPLDQSVIRQLEDLNHDFFLSLDGDSDMLSTFDKSWRAFSQSVTLCHDRLRSDTLEMVFSFAATVSTIVSGVLDLESAGARIRNQFSTDVTKILDQGMSRLGIDDNPAEKGTIKIFFCRS